MEGNGNANILGNNSLPEGVISPERCFDPIMADNVNIAPNPDTAYFYIMNAAGTAISSVACLDSESLQQYKTRIEYVFYKCKETVPISAFYIRQSNVEPTPYRLFNFSQRVYITDRDAKRIVPGNSYILKPNGPIGRIASKRVIGGGNLVGALHCGPADPGNVIYSVQKMIERPAATVISPWIEINNKKINFDILHRMLYIPEFKTVIKDIIKSGSLKHRVNENHIAKIASNIYLLYKNLGGKPVYPQDMNNGRDMIFPNDNTSNIPNNVIDHMNEKYKFEGSILSILRAGAILQAIEDGVFSHNMIPDIIRTIKYNIGLIHDLYTSVGGVPLQANLPTMIEIGKPVLEIVDRVIQMPGFKNITKDLITKRVPINPTIATHLYLRYKNQGGTPLYPQDPNNGSRENFPNGNNVTGPDDVIDRMIVDPAFRTLIQKIIRLGATIDAMNIGLPVAPQYRVMIDIVLDDSAKKIYDRYAPTAVGGVRKTSKQKKRSRKNRKTHKF